MGRESKCRGGAGAEGLDISDVDVLLSLSCIIGRHPASLTKVGVERNKKLLAQHIIARDNGGRNLLLTC